MQMIPFLLRSYPQGQGPFCLPPNVFRLAADSYCYYDHYYYCYLEYRILKKYC